jgi:signal transduction histidine kinase
MPMRPAAWPRSLRFRLLAATLVVLAVALVLAGLLLAGLFRDHVMRQFGDSLTAQLDQVTARLEFDAAGEPQIDPQALSDPRWSRPYSGLYWQVDAGAGPQRSGRLRSRSLWDATLAAPNDAMAPGAIHLHEVTGPRGERLLLVERTVTRGDSTAEPWRVLVAADLGATAEAVERFNGVLATSLGVLLVLLSLGAVAQVAVGLSPLRSLQRALTAVHAGTSPRLEGRFPAEVQPLIDDFNAVLERNAEVVARARTQAGNLAHAIKTPLAVLDQAAAAARQGSAATSALAAQVQEQVAQARRHIDWHLARARAAGARGLPGQRVAVSPVVSSLERVMARVHADRRLNLRIGPVPPELAFAGELQDLQEILGNLLDNACKWARHEVQISATPVESNGPQRLKIAIDDDGPGIDADRREAALARGARLDESVPGSGLGLAIVSELVELYGGSVRLLASPLGGLRAELELPRG